MDILFYSNKNDFSKMILYKIKSENIVNIKTINIDKNNRIPKCIKVVPALYLYKTKKIVIDEKILQFITKNSKKEEEPSNSIPNLFENSSIETDYSLDHFFNTTNFNDITSIDTKNKNDKFSEQDITELINKRKMI